MENDGFSLVVRKRKLRKMREARMVNYIDLFTGVPVECIDRVMQYAVEKMRDSSFCRFTIQAISKVLLQRGPSSHLAQIRAIGVGHFCNKGYQDYGCHQLALLILLKEFFGCSVTFQEPVATENEKAWLRSKEIQFKDSTNLKERSALSGIGAVTLFYMPHCDAPLYNNVIYAHRSQRCLQNIIIVGNDLVSFMVNRRYEHELDALCSYRRACEMIHLPEYKESPHSFNNTAIHFLDKEYPEILEDEPKYEFYKLEGL